MQLTQHCATWFLRGCTIKLPEQPFKTTDVSPFLPPQSLLWACRHTERLGDHRTMRIDADGASSSPEEELEPEPGMRTARP